MVFINEWLPNPKGVDAGKEFIELYNSGASAVSLRGWTLETESKKAFSLSGRTVTARGYLLLWQRETKLSLRNTNGSISLYAPDGRLVERANFMGTAPGGKSFSRVDYGVADRAHFAFADPTPGKENKTISTSIAVHEYPRGVPLNHLFSPGEFLGMIVGTANLLVGLIMYIIHSHEDLSKLLFGTNEKAGGGAREEAF